MSNNQTTEPAVGHAYGSENPPSKSDTERLREAEKTIFWLQNPPKQLHIAYILLMFLGFLGAHRFYQGKTGTGLLWLFTVGLLGVGIIVDAFTLKDQVEATNRRIRS